MDFASRMKKERKLEMPFIIERNDITRMRVDAIVNAANNSLLGGGGVDGAIHRAAGPGLLAECRKLGGCETGEAKYTQGYDLPAKYVIHTVGPIWSGGGRGEEALLRSCYRNSLRIAGELGCETVAFPLISAGVYGYPKRAAIEVAESEIRAFLEEHDMTVTLVIFDPSSFRLSSSLMGDLRAYIDDNYYNAHADTDREMRWREERIKANAYAAYQAVTEAPAAKPMAGAAKPSHKPEKPSFFDKLKPKPKAEKAEANLAGVSPADVSSADGALLHAVPAPVPEEPCEEAVFADAREADADLETLLESLDESFSQNLLHRIDASGMTDAECYKRANIDRKLFSKIRSDPHYRPSKPTVIAFAIALGLDLTGTNDLLRRAGFALSRSSKFDVIVEYFIKNGMYDIFEINDALFAYDQPLLGAQ